VNFRFSGVECRNSKMITFGKLFIGRTGLFIARVKSRSRLKFCGCGTQPEEYHSFKNKRCQPFSRDAGRMPVQRDTCHEPIKVLADGADFSSRRGNSHRPSFDWPDDFRAVAASGHSKKPADGSPSPGGESRDERGRDDHSSFERRHPRGLIRIGARLCEPQRSRYSRHRRLFSAFLSDKVAAGRRPALRRAAFTPLHRPNQPARPDFLTPQFCAR